MKQFFSIAIALCSMFPAFGQQACIDRYLVDPLTYTDIVTSADQVDLPRDLDFKPYTNELWVMGRGTGNGGDMVIVHNAGSPGQTSEFRKDTHSGHFMIQASAMAFSNNGEWAAVSEVQNTASPTSTFMGPALWLGDLNIFATVFQNNWVAGLPLGSHIDMLHQSPFAMGIAADSLKCFWVMDGHFGNICRYDFVQDHGPGYDDHSAGKIWRYIDVPVTRVPDIPSHMVLDRENHWLYFVDGGPKQIKRLNVLTGAVTGNLTVPATSNEPLASYKKVEGATVEIVDTWGSGQPCGIDYVDGRLIVSDNTNGDIRIYDVTGSPTYMGTVATGQSGIMGVKVGPDGRIWFVDYDSDKAVRIDPLPLANDAAIIGIVDPQTVTAEPVYYSPGNTVCAASIAPTVKLQNNGSNDLSAVEIHFQIDSDPETSFGWTGLLASGASTDVLLPSVALATSAHKLRVWTAQPNGVSDSNPLDDEMRGSFRAKTPPQVLPFAEGFESSTFPPVGWDYVHFNPNCEMARVTSASGMGLSTACVKMDNYSGDMDITGQKDYLMLPPIDLGSALPGTELGFYVAHRQYNSGSNDKLSVKASTDCGANWTEIYSKAGAALATAPTGTADFTPTAAQWRLEAVDLDAYVGQPEVLLMFEAESNWGNNVYIDDVEIGTAVGVAENSAMDFDLFPNPASEQVTLSLPTTGPDATVSVLDLQGQVFSIQRVPTGARQLTLELTNMADGAYLLELKDATGRATKLFQVMDAGR